MATSEKAKIDEGGIGQQQVVHELSISHEYVTDI